MAKRSITGEFELPDAGGLQLKRRLSLLDPPPTRLRLVLSWAFSIIIAAALAVLVVGAHVRAHPYDCCHAGTRRK